MFYVLCFALYVFEKLPTLCKTNFLLRKVKKLVLFFLTKSAKMSAKFSEILSRVPGAGLAGASPRAPALSSHRLPSHLTAFPTPPPLGWLRVSRLVRANATPPKVLCVAFEQGDRPLLALSSSSRYRTQRIRSARRSLCYLRCAFDVDADRANGESPNARGASAAPCSLRFDALGGECLALGGAASFLPPSSLVFFQTGGQFYISSASSRVHFERPPPDLFLSSAHFHMES